MRRRKEMERECPYIESRPKDLVCGASVTNMVPSVAEFTTYCGTEEHYRCAILLARVLRDLSAPQVRKNGAAYGR